MYNFLRSPRSCKLRSPVSELRNEVSRMVPKYQRISLLRAGGEIETVVVVRSGELLVRVAEVVEDSSCLVLMAEHP